MANSVPFRTTPQLGPQLSDVFTGLPYWDTTLGVGTSIAGSPSYKLGNRETGDDGAEYIWVQANGVIASNPTGVNLAIAYPTYLATTGGSSGWYSPANTALVAGQYFHARLGAPGSLPVS